MPQAFYSTYVHLKGQSAGAVAKYTQLKSVAQLTNDISRQTVCAYFLPR